MNNKEYRGLTLATNEVVYGVKLDDTHIGVVTYNKQIDKFTVTDCKVQKGSIGRYTGYNDIDGNPIYEGMEVTIPDPDSVYCGKRFKVVFQEGAFYIGPICGEFKLFSWMYHHKLLRVV